ncbi:MAG: hypothetical protein SFV52_08980 [Saprospiraceae bacterium]|nr:hypothetical protein [Saprospiraceae bacterium]
MTPVLQRVAAIVCALLAASAVYFHLGDALWNDEIYTLEHFVFKGIGTVLTDYHVPNNHILSNAAHWLWVKVTAADGLGILLDHPWRMRLLPLAFSALTVWFVYRAGAHIGAGGVAWLPVVLLLSGVTFQAYAFQIRGYALSMTAAAAVSAFLLQWTAGKPLGRLQHLGLALASAVMLYALPSNLYCWMAAVAGVVLAQALSVRSAGMAPVLPVAGSLLGGGLLAFLCYQPVLGQLLGSAYFAPGASFRADHATQFGLVLSHFISWRWLLVPVCLAGAYWGWLQGSAARRQLTWMVTVLVVPFLLSAMRGDLPPERVFLVLLPVFSLAAAATVHFAATQLPARQAGLAYASLLLYCALSYGLGVQWVRDYLRKGLSQTSHYYPGLNFNYYQHFFDPNAEYDLFRKKFGTDRVLILESSEEHDMPVYLRHKKQAFVPLDSIEAFLNRRQTLYVSSTYAKAFMQEMAKMGPAWRCRYLQNRDRLPQIVVCEPVAGR